MTYLLASVAVIVLVAALGVCASYFLLVKFNWIAQAWDDVISRGPHQNSVVTTTLPSVYSIFEPETYKDAIPSGAGTSSFIIVRQEHAFAKASELATSGSETPMRIMPPCRGFAPSGSWTQAA